MSSDSRQLLVAQRFDRVQPRRLERGPQPGRRSRRSPRSRCRCANDHHGSETGSRRARCTTRPISAAEHDARAARRSRSGTRPRAGTARESPAGAAPSALRMPISRVRSVTEIVMMAITPMPPTMSAIDEITTSARKIARRELVEDVHDRVRRSRCRSRSPDPTFSRCRARITS